MIIIVSPGFYYPPFFIWMLAAVWWHCGQGLMRVLLDSDWSTPDQVSSEILKTDSSSFLLNPRPIQTCAMIVPRVMTTCLWTHICDQQLLLLLQVSLLYYVLMYITCIAHGAYCIFVNMVFKVIAPCLCIFVLCNGHEFPALLGQFMPYLSHGYLTGLNTLRISRRTALGISPLLPLLHVGMGIFLCGLSVIPRVHSVFWVGWVSRFSRWI